LIYIDTSLLLPTYVQEKNSVRANEFLRGGVPQFLVSDLTVAELYVGLARKVKLGSLSAASAEEAWSLFEAHLKKCLFRRIALVSSHSEAAGQLAVRSPVMLRTLDAIHLAVAIELDASLGTLDGRLSDAAQALGVEVLP
jgi:uncharacterized protein